MSAERAPGVVESLLASSVRSCTDRRRAARRRTDGGLSVVGSALARRHATNRIESRLPSVCRPFEFHLSRARRDATRSMHALRSSAPAADAVAAQSRCVVVPEHRGLTTVRVHLGHVAYVQ